MVFHNAIAVMRNNFIFPVTQNAMRKLVPAGIPQHFLKYIYEFVLRGSPKDKKEPKKFDIKDLEFGFVIHMALCAISIVVFVLENLIYNFKKFVELKIILRGLRAY
jgi:hypothetical protein